MKMQELVMEKLESTATDAGFTVGEGYAFSNMGTMYVMTPDLRTIITVEFDFQPDYVMLDFQEPGQPEHSTMIHFGEPDALNEILAEWETWVEELRQKHSVEDKDEPTAHLVVKMDNAAFDEPGRELAAILEELASIVARSLRRKYYFFRTIRDSNGNAVGEFEVTV